VSAMTPTELRNYLWQLLEDGGDDLTEWETDFLESLMARLPTKLSDKQTAVVLRIEEKVRGPI